MVWAAATLTLIASMVGQVSLNQAVLTADKVFYERGHRLMRAEGHARLSRDALLIRGDRITYDEKSHRATAQGHVLMTEGNLAATSEQVEVDVQSHEATLKSGLFYRKKNVTPQQLQLAQTPEDLRNLGVTTQVIAGTHVRKIADDRYLVDGLNFTPCDCDAAHPNWYIAAAHADLETNQRAILEWPVVYVHDVPIFAAPWLYLPLQNRSTGLLIPKPTPSALRGFSLEQPVFIALGRSYDLTVTPGYFFGPGNGDKGATPFGGNPNPFGMKGPRLFSEFNYAPNEGTRGRITLGVVDDLRLERDPVDPGFYPPSSTNPSQADGRRRGFRGEANVQHLQDLGNGFYDRIDASFLSDGYYKDDVTADVLAHAAQYLNSTATFYHRSRNAYQGIDVGLRQDIRYGYGFFGNDRTPDGKPIQGPNPLQKLPSVTWAMPSQHVIGPVFADWKANFNRLSPFHGNIGDGVFIPFTPNKPEVTDLSNPNYNTADGTPGGKLYQSLARQSRDRLDLSPGLNAHWTFGNALNVDPYLAYREDLYLGEASRTGFHRGYFLAGASLSTELSKSIAFAGNIYRHSIRPVIEIRGVPHPFGTSPALLYDEVDRAVPDTGFLQGTAEVRQRFYLKTPTENREVFGLDLGQGMARRPGGFRLADTYGRAAFEWMRFRPSILMRYDLQAQKMTGLSPALEWDDGRGSQLRITYDNFFSGGNDRSRRGIDMLVGSPFPTCIPTVANASPAGLNGVPTDPCQPNQELRLFASTRFKFGLGFSLMSIIQPINRVPSPSGPVGAAYAAPFQQQRLGVSYGPGCDCWRIEAFVSLLYVQGVTGPPALKPDFGSVNLTISNFGSFGVNK